MARPGLKLYFDILSPFAYIAFHVIRHSRVFEPCNIEYIPVLLGGILKQCGNTPPVFVKNKDKWIDKERHRWASIFNVPFGPTFPDPFPVATLQVESALAALSVIAPEHLASAAAALYERFFVDVQPISHETDFMPVLEEQLGEELASSIASKMGVEGKDVLTRNTDQAIADGAFGLPYFVATSSEGVVEGYWGFDHLAQVADHLGLERPKPGSRDEGGWKLLL